MSPVLEVWDMHSESVSIVRIVFRNEADNDGKCSYTHGGGMSIRARRSRVRLHWPRSLASDIPRRRRSHSKQTPADLGSKGGRAACEVPAAVGEYLAVQSQSARVAASRGKLTTI